MKVCFAFLLLAIACLPAVAQSDTTIKYFSKNNRETTADSAVTYCKFYKQGNLWHGSEYYKNGKLKSDGTYAEMDYSTPVGIFKNYKEDGSLYNTAEYNDGKPVEKTYYYKNGNKKSWIRYTEKGENENKGWDENGKELRNYIVEREARFKGGLDGWRKFLEKHLNANIAADAGAPEGRYEVVTEFVVNKEGLVSNIKVVSVPAKCKPCGAEAIRVLGDAPEWEPAIVNNEPVNYMARQQIVFLVEEVKKKGKG